MPNKKDKRAYQNAYQKQLQQIKAGQRVTGNLAPFVHSEIKVFDDRVLVPLGAIVILKSNTAYVAIKPISLELKYKSLKEVPKWAQESWIEYTKEGKVPPFHSMMTYEWKYWPLVRGPCKAVKTRTPEEILVWKAKKKEWEVSEVLPLEKFSIGGIKFSWKINAPDDKFNPLALSFKKRDQTIPIKDVEYERREETPREYIVRNPHVGKLESRETGFELTFQWAQGDEGDGSYLSIKIDRKHILIKPLFKNKDGLITYKWKYWPEVLPAELAKTTALSK